MVYCRESVLKAPFAKNVMAAANTKQYPTAPLDNTSEVAAG